MLATLLLLVPSAWAQPAIELSEEDQAAEDAGTAPTGQADPLLGDLWDKSFLTGTEDQKVSLGGYFETEYHDNFRDLSYFDQHRLVLFVYARLHDRMTFASEIEWEHGGSPRKSNGELEVGEVLLEYAVGDFRATEWLQFRAGIVLVPMGAYNLRHDAPTQDFTTRPLVSTYVLPSTWFETGAGLFGNIPLGAHMLKYEAYVINGLDTKLYDDLGARAARGSLGEDNNVNKAMVGRVSYQPLGSVDLGLSGYRGAYDPDSTRYVHMGAVDLTARWRWLEFQGEMAMAAIDPGFDEGWAEATREPVPEGMDGYYAQVNAHFMPAFLTAAMPDDLKDFGFTGVVRLGHIDTDTGVDTRGDKARLMLGLNLRPIEQFVWKNEVLLDTNADAGDLTMPWSSGYKPEAKYVTSLALAF